MFRHSTFRKTPLASHLSVFLAILICCALLFSTLVIPGRAAPSLASGQGQTRRGRPEAGPPAADLPNLDEVRRRRAEKPHAPPHVPSLMRGRRKPLEPRNGLKVGDPGTTSGARNSAQVSTKADSDRVTDAVANSNVANQPTDKAPNSNAKGAKYSAKGAESFPLHSSADSFAVSALKSSSSLPRAKQGGHVGPPLRAKRARNHARTSRSLLLPVPYPVGEDQYVRDFHQLALARQPYTWNPNEQGYWDDILKAAHAHDVQGQGAMVLAARELGKTLFESAEYAARNRSNHEYVYDLYKTYLLREPDAGGWAWWESLVAPCGREAVRRAFDECGEFVSAATVSVTGNPSTDVTSLLTARVDPINQSGNQVQARDAAWSIMVVSLPGRAGLDLGLTLSFSSAAVYTRSGPYIYLDEDNSSLSPGFRLGFPTVQEKFFDAQVGQNAYLLIASAGSRVELRQVGTSNIYEAADSSYLQLTDNGSSLLLRATDGTQMSYTKIENEWRCTTAKDRNGNFITVNYNTFGDITTISDTVGRTINFNYDGNANLIAITQNWTVNGQQQTHTWATFTWGTTTIQPSFSGLSLSGIASGQSIPVVTQVGLDDGSYYKFIYDNGSATGLVKTFEHWAIDGLHKGSVSYDYAIASGDGPRITAAHAYADYWNGYQGVPADITTQFSAATDHSWSKVTMPDNTVFKEYYGTGMQAGLTIMTKSYASAADADADSDAAPTWKKRTTTAWTQDGGVSYQTNPRVTETNIYDSSLNRRRTMIEYSGSFGLPGLVTEYGADGAHSGSPCMATRMTMLTSAAGSLVCRTSILCLTAVGNSSPRQTTSTTRTMAT